MPLSGRLGTKRQIGQVMFLATCRASERHGRLAVVAWRSTRDALEVRELHNDRPPRRSERQPIGGGSGWLQGNVLKVSAVNTLPPSLGRGSSASRTEIWVVKPVVAPQSRSNITRRCAR